MALDIQNNQERQVPSVEQKAEGEKNNAVFKEGLQNILKDANSGLQLMEQGHFTQDALKQTWDALQKNLNTLPKITTIDAEIATEINGILKPIFEFQKKSIRENTMVSAMVSKFDITS